MMNLTQVNNDVRIAEIDVLLHIGKMGLGEHDYPAGVSEMEDRLQDIYDAAAVADASLMANLTKIKNVRDRRAAQAGVRPEFVRVEVELQKILPGAIVERGGAEYAADGFRASVSLSIEEQMERVTSFRSRPTGKHKFVVGYHGERKSFPEKKDGSFSYDKIAQEIAARLSHDINKMKLAKETASASASAKVLVEELRNRFGVGEYEGVFETEMATGGLGNYHVVAPKPGKVFMKVGMMQVTPEQAVELYELLQRLGLKK